MTMSTTSAQSLMRPRRFGALGDWSASEDTARGDTLRQIWPVQKDRPRLSKWGDGPRKRAH
jgi:hypothetical protein